jgi:hypothetical protein
MGVDDARGDDHAFGVDFSFGPEIRRQVAEALNAPFVNGEIGTPSCEPGAVDHDATTDN